MKKSLILIWISFFIGITYSQQFFYYPSKHIRGGQLQPTVFSIGDCVRLCQANSATCAGIDFNQGRCYFHTSATECGAFITKPGCIHVRLIFCGATTVVAPTPAAGDTPTTVAPIGVPSLAGINALQDFYIRDGVRIRFALTRESCYKVCFTSKICMAFDWDRGRCYVHTMITACNDLKRRPGSDHYKLKANCNPVPFNCFSVRIETFPGQGRPGGVRIAFNVNFARCQVLCRARTNCQAVDWDRRLRACFEHTTTGRPLPSTCCDHARKICNDGDPPGPGVTTTIPTVTTRKQPTTRPPQVTVPPKLVPDDGICPSEIQAVDNTLTPGGIDVPDINNADECKEWCLAEPNCTAVEFNRVTADGKLCKYHNMTDVITDATTDTCCVQYRRLSPCEEKQCWVMAKMPVTTGMGANGSASAANASGVFVPDDALFNLDSSNITNTSTDAILVPCPGLCKITADYSREMNGTLNPFVQAEAERSCDTSYDAMEFRKSKSRKNCITEIIDEDEDTGTQNVTVTCYCQTDQCNAAWVEVLDSCIAYFPLDGHAEDMTFGRRNGQAYNLEYSATDHVKNWSAIFNGSSFIQVDTFRNNLLGQITPEKTNNFRPEFTLLFWFKFTERIAENMSIINNGPHDRASLDIQTSYVDDMTRDIHASVRIDGKQYDGKVSAVYDEWQYFALRIFPVTNYDILLDVGNTTDITDSLGIETDITTDMSVHIDTLRSPLSIGKQYIPTPLPFYQVPSEFYTGQLDEIYMFGRGLDNLELNSIVQQSYWPVRLNPLNL